MLYSSISKSNSVKPFRQTDTKSEENIYNSLKFFMIFSQFLGIFPQIIGKDSASMHFKWRSWQIIYSFLVTFGLALTVALCFLDWFHLSYNFNHLVTHIFYAGGLFTLILYVRLAKIWPDFIRKWCLIDKIMSLNYGYPQSLNRRLRSFSIIFLVLGLADYILSVASHARATANKLGHNSSMEAYYKEHFPYYFNYLPYNPFVAVLCSLLTVIATFTWAFNDLFIILLSICLALRFKQITDRLKLKEKQAVANNFWMEIREDYDRLCELCKELDNNINYIVLLSFSLNMFYLLVQLYHSLEPINDPVEKVYFIFSFGYMILKLVSVSLYAAWINDESKAPANLLNSVPSITYNLEIRRLLTQISFDSVALTGNKMFKVTRGLILNVAGAIVTYELVLIQFNTATVGSEPKN